MLAMAGGAGMVEMHVLESGTLRCGHGKLLQAVLKQVAGCVRGAACGLATPAASPSPEAATAASTYDPPPNETPRSLTLTIPNKPYWNKFVDKWKNVRDTV